MQDLELTEMTTQELKSLSKKIDKHINLKLKSDRAFAKKKIIDLSLAYNIDLEKIMQYKAVIRRPSHKKYCHPSDENKFWSGRGRKPEWLKSLLRSGHSLESLLNQ